MINSAKMFKEFYLASFSKDAGGLDSQRLSDEFIANFISTTPVKLQKLQSYLNEGKIEDFYNSLPDLKLLVEFSDYLNRYWYLLRGYSGALAKLKANPTVKGTKRLLSYYFEKYGDRRILRNEHWFEKKRWEFLDELNDLYNDVEIELFLVKYQRILSDNFEIYSSFVSTFISCLEED